MRRILAALLVCLASVGQGRAAPALSALNVQPSELPRSAVLLADVIQTAAGYAADTKKPISYYRKVGLVSVSERVYIGVPTTPADLLAVVRLFSASAGAHALYELQRGDLINGGGQRDKLVATGPLGDEGFVLSGVDDSQKPAPPMILVFFRRGRYQVVLLLDSPAKAFGISHLLFLAHLLDARIKAAR